MHQGETRLTILIPTFNRCGFLLRNLGELSAHLRALKLTGRVNLVISDNASADSTADAVREFQRMHRDLAITLLVQERNLGLQANVLEVLRVASAPFVMYLGDDDYVSAEYLKEVWQVLDSDPEVGVILPSFQCISLAGELLKGIGRDVGVEGGRYPGSFDSCLEFSWRGHQLSGVVLRRAALYEEYTTRRVNNLYPFIFFVAFTALRGSVHHLTDHPVLVSRPGQEKKDWGYGEDGLVPDIFNNYRKLFPWSPIRRFRLESKLLKEQERRYQVYLKHGWGRYLRAIALIVVSPNTGCLTKLVFPTRLFWNHGKALGKKGVRWLTGKLPKVQGRPTV